MSGTTGVSLQQLVQQGTLNRLRSSIVIPSNPTLNVNADHAIFSKSALIRYAPNNSTG